MTTTSSGKSLNEILHANGKLTDIIRKIDGLKKIECLTHKALSEILFTSVTENSFSRELINAIHVTDYDKGRLLLLCDNGAISTRLRYLLPELTHALRNNGKMPNLTRIDLKIAQTATTTVPPSSTKVKISTYNSKLLKDTLSKLRT